MCESSTAAISSGVPSATIRPPGLPALRTHIDDPVGGMDHVEIVLDHQQRSAVIDQAFKGRQQLPDVVEVQPGGGLVADEQRAVVGRLRQVRGQLDALRFAAGERCRRLPQPQVSQADFVQQFQPQ